LAPPGRRYLKRKRIEDRRQKGCGCVEMEAAALFAVAQFRNVQMAQILYAGEDLSGEFWDSGNWHNRSDIREMLLGPAIEACLKIRPDRVFLTAGQPMPDNLNFMILKGQLIPCLLNRAIAGILAYFPVFVTAEPVDDI